MEPAWYESRYGGIFTHFGMLRPRAADPDVAMCAATLAPRLPRPEPAPVGGAGWNVAAARGACIGEALERYQTYPLRSDRTITASYQAWPSDEPAIEPERWALFHAEQYASPAFPFSAFDRATECRWVCFRDVPSGEPVWVPEDLAYLFPRPGAPHSIAPMTSTGLSCGRAGDPVLLRGLQEAIERDAIVGAWWQRYRLEEHEPARVFGLCGEAIARQAQRPNIAYRFYRVDTPFSAHAVIVTASGQEREGVLFSTGAACRSSRADAWQKALLECIQGRHYVRYLREQGLGTSAEPLDFAQHALYYTLHPEALARTPLASPAPARDSAHEEQALEHLAHLLERLGPKHPVLARSMTPPNVATAGDGWYVLKVLAIGLQPLHGNHALAHLGGPLWAPRGLAEWRHTLPHPFA